MSKTYVLDANAVIRLVEDEAGAHRVERLIEEAVTQGSVLLMSVLNWGEVFYYAWQRHGEEWARQTMAKLSRVPLDLIAVDLPQALTATEIRAVHNVPYVDSVAAALAETRRATLVTSDRDFEKLGRRIPILWIARMK